MQIEQQIGGTAASVDRDRSGERETERLDDDLVVAGSAVDCDRIDIGQRRGVGGLAGGVGIPTLEETLMQCRDRVLLNVEIKQVSSLRQFLQLIRSRTDAVNVILTSFDRDLVSRLGQVAPDFRRGVITATDEDVVDLAKKTASDLIAPYFGHVTGDVVSRARAAGLPLFVWGCRDMIETKAALRLGIDGIVTDFPDETAREIARLADR